MKAIAAVIFTLCMGVNSMAQMHGVNPKGYTDVETDQLKGAVKEYTETTYEVDYTRHVVENGSFVSCIERTYDENGSILTERTFDVDGQKLTGTLYQYKDSVKHVTTTHDANGKRTLQMLYLFTADGFCARIRVTDAIGVTISTSEISHGDNWASASERYNDGETLLTTYKYDSAHNLVSIIKNGDSKSETTLSYPLFGDKNKRLPNKTVKKERETKVTYTYTYETDDRGNWTKRVVYTDGIPTEVAYRQLAYWK